MGQGERTVVAPVKAPARSRKTGGSKSSRKDGTPGRGKKPWLEEEDRKVIELVKIHGAKNWPLIAAHMPGRVGKQCRER